MDKLQGVAHTLFIPLTARIFASKVFPEYFYDPKALELEAHIPDDSIRRRSSQYALMASVARYHNADAMVAAFMAAHGACNVIFIGAGLETIYYRLGPREAIFYEVDLPPVAEVRRAVLGEHHNDIIIAGDAFDLGWAARMDTSLPTLLVALGVFQYFTVERVGGFIRDIAGAFERAELIFDATNAAGLRFANRYVKKTGNAHAHMDFYINDGAAFTRETGTTLLEQRGFFAEARKILGPNLNLYTRIAMRVADGQRRTFLLHLKIK